MGPYCSYCDRRCFVPRLMPHDAKRYAGGSVIMATCPEGAAHDLEATGYTYITAVNPAYPHRQDAIDDVRVVVDRLAGMATGRAVVTIRFEAPVDLFDDVRIESWADIAVREAGVRHEIAKTRPRDRQR